MGVWRGGEESFEGRDFGRGEGVRVVLVLAQWELGCVPAHHETLGERWVVENAGRGDFADEGVEGAWGVGWSGEGVP